MPLSLFAVSFPLHLVSSASFAGFSLITKHLCRSNMVRIKMPLRLIEGEKHRNMTFMKRRVAIKKKAEELSTLCDIATLLVCYGPRGQLETWPKDPLEVRGMIDLYRSLRPDDCIKRRYGLATFFEGHLKKLQADLARARESWLDRWSEEPLEELPQYLDAKLDAIEEMMSHPGPEDVCRLGKETEVWEGQHLHNQFQQVPGGMPFSLPLDDNAILGAQPIQSIETIDFSGVKKEDFNGRDLQGHASAAGAAFWEVPRGLQLRSQPPGALTYSATEPYTLPILPDTTPGFSMADLPYVDDLIFPNRLLAMDLATYPAVASASCTSSVAGTLAPAITAFAPSFTYDAPLGYSSGGGGGTGIIGNSEELLPLFDRPLLDAGYGFPRLNRRATSNTAVACHEAFYQNELYGAEFNTGASTSLADVWSSSVFLDVPPNFCSSSDSVQVVAPGGDDSSKAQLKFV